MIEDTYQSHQGVYISTYGCQMNVNDTERMYSLLEMVNYSPVSSVEEASLIIVNSCSVREKPVHKVRSEIGKFKNLKLRRPHLKIGVGGCVGQQEKAQLLKDIPLLDFVFGTDSIDELPKIIGEVKARAVEYENKTKSEQRKAKKNKKTKVANVYAKFQHQEPYHIQTMVRNPGVSTFVNIMKGCDNFCSFCVVPFTRGREKSRPLDDILQDVNNLVKRGVKEVTLVGQNVNSYKSKRTQAANHPKKADQPLEAAADVNFADLLECIARDTQITRLRYTTPHPKDFDQDVLAVLKKYKTKTCSYMHLPAQSGDTEVLDRMNRGYSRTEYLAKVKMIRAELPDVSLSTDLIVGFPGETEEQFEATLSLMEEVKYETIFAFKYSPRPFTKAARFEDQVPEDVKTRRLNRLFEVQKIIAAPLCQNYLNQELEVLVEEYNADDSTCMGRCSQNKKVHFKGTESLVGQLRPIRITKAFPAVLHGEMVI